MAGFLSSVKRRLNLGPEPSGDVVVDELRRALAPERVRYDGAERSLLSRDASVFDGGVAGPVCFPVSTSEVQSIMRIAGKDMSETSCPGARARVLLAGLSRSAHPSWWS